MPSKYMASSQHQHHRPTTKLRVHHFSSFYRHARSFYLMPFARLTIILLCLYKPVASIQPINPFIGIPIIVDHAPQYSTPAAYPSEQLALSNEVSYFGCRVTVVQGSCSGFRVSFQPRHVAGSVPPIAAGAAALAVSAFV